MELVAAIVGTMVGMAGMGVGSILKRGNSDREAIVKLSMGVEHIGRELQAMRGMIERRPTRDLRTPWQH